MTNYKITIGLEIHLKINSKTKIFCQCPNEQNFDELMPNTNICPTCTGQPGALPTLSTEVVGKALLLGKALGCTINKVSHFDRKSYFYPDLPMGYQITQLYKPTNTNGQISVFSDDFENEYTISITDAHMENDTAKMIHNETEAFIDFNRAGTPLVEVVTAPSFHSPDEVIAFLKELQRICQYNNISEAQMDKGQMRVDVNISISKNHKKLGNRVEMKNMNSFGMIKRAIEHEYARQVELCNNNEEVEQSTRGWNDLEKQSFLMRSKENALDYRYFPEPDLPALILDNKMLEKIANQELKIPYTIIKQFKEKYQFHKEYINALIHDTTVLEYFFSTLKNTKDKYEENKKAKIIAKWIAGPISAYLKENITNTDQLPFPQESFINFINLALDKKLLDNQMKIIMQEMIETGDTPEEIIKKKKFSTEKTSGEELKKIAQEILNTNPDIVQQYHEGKFSVIGFFIGQAMKKTQGKGNPQEIKKQFEQLLANQ